MAVEPNHSIDKLKGQVHIEQSASITPRITKEKKDQKPKKERRRYRPTIEELLEREGADKSLNDNTDDHIDYCA